MRTILCRRGKGEEALARMRQLMGKLKLTVNEEKTRSCKVPEGEFNFLGYTFAQFCAATFLIRAWLRWVNRVDSKARAACPHDPRSRRICRGAGSTLWAIAAITAPFAGAYDQCIFLQAASRACRSLRGRAQRRCRRRAKQSRKLI
jgi:hypothetical protein